MSKKKKKEMATILVLAAVLLVVCAAYFAVTKHNEAKQKAADTSVNLLQLDSSLVTEIALSNSNGNVTFGKDAKGWILAEDKKFEVNQDTVETLLNEVTNITAIKCVVDNKDDLEEYGLQEPAAKATVTLEDGTQVVYSIGNESIFGQEYYAALDSSDGVYLVDAANVENMLLAKDNFEEGGAQTEE